MGRPAGWMHKFTGRAAMRSPGAPSLRREVERQAVTTHKDSRIVNDANLWATETVGDSAYPLKLFQRVITVSLETMKLVRALPRLDIAVEGKD